jgi:hypothetical protein
MIDLSNKKIPEDHFRDFFYGCFFSFLGIQSLSYSNVPFASLITQEAMFNPNKAGMY